MSTYDTKPERNIRLLKHLLFIAQDVSDAEFDMSELWLPAGLGCGTVGCLMGHATRNPKYVGPFMEYTNERRPHYSDVYEACGMTVYEAAILFCNNSSVGHGVTRQQVIDNIQRLIDDKPLVCYNDDQRDDMISEIGIDALLEIAE